MESRRACTIVLLSVALAAGPALAGVVYEIEVKDHGQSPPKTETVETAAEGRSVKMGIASGSHGDRSEMVYRADRREMVVVDHADKTYTVIDEETMKQLAGQVSGVMDQMQEALKNVPADQRKAIEEMMKKRMPAQAPERPTSELRRTSERADRSGYPCVKYEILRGGQVARELWITSWSNIEGGEEMGDAFREMAKFFREMMETVTQGMPAGFGGAGNEFFEHIEEIDGFPVVTREFGDDGSLEDESTLRSARRRTLDPAEFEPPAGYKRRSMFGQ